MPRHDYNLPPDWEAKTQKEKIEWFEQERSLRQAMRQDTKFRKKREKAKERSDRRLEARSETENIEE